MIDYQKEWAVAAVPALPRKSGRVVFLAGIGNAVFVRPVGGRSIRRCPPRPEDEGWTRIDGLDALESYLEALSPVREGELKVRSR
jgi:hypothetical protein